VGGKEEDNFIGYVHQSEKKCLALLYPKGGLGGGKGAHLFIVNPNLSMDLNQVYT
jgi:hypothetical protein